MRIFNTLPRIVEDIVPLTPGQITMYTCGPTVYRNVHIGNLRTFTMADWLRRTLAYEGLTVTHIKNITDVGHMRQEVLDRGEDKLIAQARQEGKTSAQIAAFYTASFWEDEGKLNILPAHIFPKATEHIPDMLAIIQQLVTSGAAYVVEGNVFFDVTRFPSYGKLSGNRVEQAGRELRGDALSLKRHSEDFPLWRVAEPGREMAWESPWGRGFPGWHIECSAMSMKYLGPRLDIHTGGVDNIFPHHEDEIAQSEAYTGERFVSYWVHSQHLLSDGLKMAKSTGNAYTLSDIESRGFDPLALRYFYTTALYRSRINFTFSALKAAQQALNRLRRITYELARHPQSRHMSEGQWSSEDEQCIKHWRTLFLDAVRDDLNIPRAMATLWTMLHQVGTARPAACLQVLLDTDQILGFDLARLASDAAKATLTDRQPLTTTLPPDIRMLIAERQRNRITGRYVLADLQRRQLTGAGFGIRDTPSGPIVRLLSPDDEFPTISRSTAVRDHSVDADLYRFSINLLAHNSRADLERCINSIARYHDRQSIEVVVIDNGSTDDTIDYLRHVARLGHPDGASTITVQVIFADHNLGFAAGRNATMRASRGRYIMLLDTSMELRGPLWTTLSGMLDDPTIGVVGSYGLTTTDLQEFDIAAGPDVDAIEGYLMAFRRALLPDVGWIDEKFRFYRLMDIHYSFFFKTAGYRVVAIPQLAEHLEKHPHREWYTLSEEERMTRSKKNYDVFRRRWHHGQSLLAMNYQPDDHWYGHDHPHHLGLNHAHHPQDLPPPGLSHSHMHHHWPDHSHDHPHIHIPSAAQVENTDTQPITTR